MANFQDHGLKGGIWSGLLTAPDAPQRIVVTVAAGIVAQGQITPEGDGQFQIRVAIPSQVLSDGITTLSLLADGGEDGDPLLPDAQTLARLPLLAGRPLTGDILAEMDGLRAELELLKSEFRRFAASVSREG